MSTEPAVTMPGSVTRWAARDWASAAAMAVLILGLGTLSGLSNQQATREWYPTLAKPDWAPPTWLFGPVWTLLYVLMGLALWRILRLGLARPGVGPAVGLFVLQLALNLAWTPVFFSFKAIGLALSVIAALWFAIAASIAAFWRLDRRASVMLLPYLAWVSFAAALNFALWRLNGG